MTKITLRPLAEDDSADLLRWRNSPAVARWMYTDHQISAEEHARWFAKAPTDPTRVYRLIEVDGAGVGLVNLSDIDERAGRATWAYYLGEESARGKGVGAAAKYIMLEHAFGAMGLHKIWTEVLIENESAWKLHESFGFKREALFRDHVCKSGSWTDVVGMGLLASEWAEVREACRERLERRGIDVRSGWNA